MTKSTGVGRGGARTPAPGKTMGRPPKPDAPAESLRVTVSATLTAEEAQRVDAARGGKARSEWIRDLIRRELASTDNR